MISELITLAVLNRGISGLQANYYFFGAFFFADFFGAAFFFLTDFLGPPLSAPAIFYFPFC